MSHDRNIVRDRTLVLRVLVPGLHTSLNDKINSKKEGDDSQSSLSISAAAAAAPSNSSSSHQRINADQLLNLEGVTCLPSSSGSTLWHFRCDGATYPARLVNFPCPIEVHKTHDHANYHKAADIGQMLIVYEDEYAMEEAENEKGYTVDGFPSYYHSGLTPPMRRVVQRKYLSRFEERDMKPAPPPKSEVTEVEKELQDLMAKLSTGKQKGKQKKGASSTARERIIEEVEEEIVDYEPWMGEGGVFTIEDAKMHPEWWLSKIEMREIEAANKVVKEDKRRKEQEAADAAKEAQAQENIKQEAKAKRKKEKRDKKEKRKKKEEEAAAVDGKKPRKGIASRKNRDKNPLAIGDSKEAPAQEIDDAMAVAIAINEGIEEEEDFLIDGMFDFENEDNTDLLG